MSAGCVRSGRRVVVQALLALAGAAPALAAPRRRRAPKVQKQTKAAAEYQDRPKSIQMCSTCTLFEPPGACKVVIGRVSPKGWCMLYALAD